MVDNLTDDAWHVLGDNLVQQFTTFNFRTIGESMVAMLQQHSCDCQAWHVANVGSLQLPVLTQNHDRCVRYPVDVVGV